MGILARPIDPGNCGPFHGSEVPLKMMLFPKANDDRQTGQANPG